MALPAIRQKGPLADSERVPRPLRQAECRPTSACSPQSRQSTTPTDVLSQSRSAATATSLRMQLSPDARRTALDGAHERTTLSRVMRYLVPGFALTTSIESAPMRDVREISVKIGGVAGRPGQHLARFSEPALLDPLTRYTSPTRPAVPVDAPTPQCRGLFRADRPGHADTQPGAGRPGRARSGRASGAADGACPAVAAGRLPRVEVTAHPA